MLQVIEDRLVYVVEFDTMPELPITGEGYERPYAEALTAAIREGLITEPGKYGVHVTDDKENDQVIYNVYHVEE